MSYILKHLPDIDTLKLELEKYPNRILHYAKYGAFSGNSDSVQFIHSKIEEYLIKSNK